MADGAYDLLQDRMKTTRTLARLLEALSPEAAADLEDLTPLASVWRKYVVAKRAYMTAEHDPGEPDEWRPHEELESILIGMPSGSPAGALVRVIFATFEMATEALDNKGQLKEEAVFNGDEEVLFEAMLDLLQPGVMKRIAAGLAGCGAEAPARKRREPPFDVSVPTPTPGTDDALVEAERRLSALEAFWDDQVDPPDDAYANEVDALEDFIAAAPAYTAAGIKAKLARMVEYGGGDRSTWGRTLMRTTAEALDRLGA